jgi:hypothetical protein
MLALAKQLPNQTGWLEPAEAAAMTKSDFEKLATEEKQHFYQCQHCGEMVDMRQLDDVLFHEDHKPRPDIQYGGSKRLS